MTDRENILAHIVELFVVEFEIWASQVTTQCDNERWIWKVSNRIMCVKLQTVVAVKKEFKILKQNQHIWHQTKASFSIQVQTFFWLNYRIFSLVFSTTKSFKTMSSKKNFLKIHNFLWYLSPQKLQILFWILAPKCSTHLSIMC